VKASLAKVALKVPPAWVEFRGLFKIRLLLGEDGRRRFIINDLADALGMSRAALQARAKRQLGEGISMMEIPSESGDQKMVTLDLDLLPALLLGVDVARVKKALRPRLTEIKRELHGALAAYTFDGVAVNPAFAPAVPSPDIAALSAKLDELVRVGKDVYEHTRNRVEVEVRRALHDELKRYDAMLVGTVNRLQVLERSVESTAPAPPRPQEEGESKEDQGKLRAEAIARGIEAETKPLRAYPRLQGRALQCWRAAQADATIPDGERRVLRYLMARANEPPDPACSETWVWRRRKDVPEEAGFASRLRWLHRRGWLALRETGPDQERFSFEVPKPKKKPKAR